MDNAIWDVGYLVASILFILGLKKLGHPRTAPTGNLYGAMGMLLAIVVTIAQMDFGVIDNFILIGAGLFVGGLIGYVMAVRVQMTGMPEMVALFNGFGGAASALVAASEVFRRIDQNDLPEDLELYVAWIAIGLSALVGWMTLTGSLLAMMKLKGGVEIFGTWYRTPTWGPEWLNYVKGLFLIGIVGLIYMSIEEPGNQDYVIGIIALSCILGIMFVLPIGGADMPVVVSLLNSLSGIAAAFTGFIIGNNVLIIAGSMVGAAGLILTNIMCKAMNRQLIDVLFKSFGGSDKEQVTRTKVGSDPEEVAMICDGISKCVIIPGYGMAVSQCQHQVREFADILEANGCEVKYGIHPVAGRMPGHMNVLLAEASVPYEKLIEMDDINSEMAECDVALVVGANDTVNPVARSDEGPLAGMPIIDADKARVVVMVKRSLSVGYAGVDNDLFYEDKTMMLFGDGKKMMTELVRLVYNNMLEEIIIALLIVVIALMIYFNVNRSGEKEDFNIQSIKDVQVEIKEKIIERDTLDLESIEKAKLSSETEAKILREELKNLKELIENERKQRGEAYGSITENVKLLQEQYRGLELSANKLSSALKDSSMRGNWGEVQLKRVIEHSNMVNHIDYVEQKTIETSDGIQRPDAIVKMPGGRQLVIDSKAPGRLLDAYESEDIDEQEKFMKQFADDVWETVKSLGLKSYQDNIKDESGNKISPDFVIMFMPGEHMLQIALLHRPTLWEEAVERNVILASPYILLALLRSVFYSWQQEERNNNANRILEVTEQLAERINTFVGHIEGIGKGLKSSIKSYNKTIGSYNHKLLPSQKRLNKLKGASENLIEKEEIDELPREVQQKLKTE